MGEKKTSAADRHVGRRIRLRRLQLGMSRFDLAGFLNLTCQQVQKYEIGANRLSAGRLFTIATQLRVPVGYFYDGLEKDADTPKPSQTEENSPIAECAASAECRAFIEAFDRIGDRRIRQTILRLLRNLGEKS